MKFVVDECTGPNVARWLTENRHDVYSVADESRGWTDEQVLRKALAEERILITNDKDFGYLIFKNRMAHCGVILMRLEDETSGNKIAVLSGLLRGHGKSITENNFIVVTETSIRITEKNA